MSVEGFKSYHRKIWLIFLLVPIALIILTIDLSLSKNDAPATDSTQTDIVYPHYSKEFIESSVDDPHKNEDWPYIEKRLNLKPGLVVGDIGCGTGAFTFPLAQELGREGKVYALDIQARVLAHLNDKMDNLNINPYDNIVSILNTPNSTTLPENTLDRAMMIDVHFHNFDHLLPDSIKMLESVFASIKPGGTLLIVDSAYTDMQENAAKNIIRHYTAAGFELVKGPEYSVRFCNTLINNIRNREWFWPFYITFKKPGNTAG